MEWDVAVAKKYMVSKRDKKFLREICIVWSVMGNTQLWKPAGYNTGKDCF